MQARLWPNENPQSLLVGAQNGAATLENTLVLSYKTKHVLTMWSSSHPPWYLSKGTEALGPHKNLHTDVYRTLCITSKTQKQPRCPSASESINKLWSIQTMEDYASLQRNEPASHGRPGGTLNAYYDVKEANLKRLHAVWFQLCAVMKKAELWRQ